MKRHMGFRSVARTGRKKRRHWKQNGAVFSTGKRSVLLVKAKEHRFFVLGEERTGGERERNGVNGKGDKSLLYGY